jgi:2-dehydro-3-deoxyphosphogluconate aldolase/(4S)-4-hydroxy-2-oxoglutarate aldolase
MSPDRLKSIKDAGVVAVVRAPAAAAAVSTADALIAGGVRAIEITFTTPDATTAIAELAARYGDSIVLGAGTIVVPAQAEAAAAAGAAFLVSPGSSPGVAKAMTATGRVVMLGALTPTEVMAAMDLGADAIKVFPGSLGGPAYLRSLRGPFPRAPFLPTGGVTAGNLGEWFAAGVTAVGAGSELCPAAAIAAGHWDVITGNAEEFTAALDRARA